MRRANVTLPWVPVGEIEANLAMGSLRDLLFAWLTTAARRACRNADDGGRVACGLRRAAGGVGPDPQSGTAGTEGRLRVATTASGERFYFGDLINGYLIPEGARDWTVWGFAAAAAVEAGLPEAELPDYADMFAHVTRTIGTKDFGVPRVQTTTCRTLPTAGAQDVLAASEVHPRADRRAGAGPERRRGRALAGGHRARDAADHPDEQRRARSGLSLRLAMELAISMSKIDPETVPKTVAAVEQA